MNFCNSIQASFVLAMLFSVFCTIESIVDNTLNQQNQDNSNDMSDNLKRFYDRLYGFPSKKSGERVAKWRNYKNVTPEELGMYAEGDILQMPRLFRIGLTNEGSIWPDAIVPYTLSVDFDSQQQRTIFKAMEIFQRETCIKFTPHTYEENYIHIAAEDTGCWSSVGMITYQKQQTVNLQPNDCMNMRSVLHELMHVLGFTHEHNRKDRDNYITILWENIEPSEMFNFKQVHEGPDSDYGVGYDYDSVTHYSEKAFSRNGLPTMIPKGNNVISLKPYLSDGDIKKIKTLYKCP